MAIGKEQLKQVISENNITNVGDIYSLLKDSFKDILQELLEAEMEASIGYAKNEKARMMLIISAMATLPKQLKVSLASSLLIFLGTEMVNSNLKLYLNIKGIYLVSRSRLFLYTHVE